MYASKPDCIVSVVSAVQNERQPRNSAQVRQEQIEQELENKLTPGTVSATHPAFTPLPTGHRPFAPSSAACAAAAMHAAELAHAFKEDSELLIAFTDITS